MTQLMFSRRAIQLAIDRLGSTLDADDLANLVGALNRPGKDRVIRLWEVVLFDALAATGGFRHEHALPNNRRPDFAFDLDHPKGATTVVGDITCLSDDGLDNNNPIDAFAAEVRRVAGKLDVDSGRLRIDVSGETIGPHGDARMRLHLPSKAGIKGLVDSEVHPFLKRVARSPEFADQMRLSQDGTGVTITYDPAKRHFGLARPVYEVPYSVDRNPLWTALQSKADQLRSAPEDWVRLVIVCDGNSTMLHNDGAGSHYRTKTVVDDFLRRSGTIDAVFLLAVTEDFAMRYPRHEIAIEPRLFMRPATPKRAALAQIIESELTSRMDGVARHLPRPLMTAVNALHRSNAKDFTAGPNGAYTMTDNTLRISSREVLEILAGTQPPGRESTDWSRLVAVFMAEGRMLSSVRVVPGAADDDELLLEFGEPDPAISPFRMPKANG